MVRPHLSVQFHNSYYAKVSHSHLNSVVLCFLVSDLLLNLVSYVVILFPLLGLVNKAHCHCMLDCIDEFFRFNS